MTDDVVIRIEGAAGRITLNRPKALNALNRPMTDAITAALVRWRDDASVKHVVIDGAGGRAFCAGGDIRAVYDMIPTDPEFPRAYWRAEYRLNAMIARYEKPYVALMDGFCLGGGVGLSAHGSHRIVTERSFVGMPETAIGFTPDVGGAWLLARAPGHAGEYMAAVAYRMNAADAIYAGFADTMIRAEDIPAFVAALSEGQDAGETARRFSIPPGASGLAARQADIDLIFGTETVQEAARRLKAMAGPWAEETLGKISSHSPTALAAAHFSVRKVRGFGRVEESLDHEYRYAHRATGLHDFREGVRALIVDKDGKPQWRPAHLDDVRMSDVVALFAPLGKDELGLAAGS
ncbi:enoyl-CoA hydratase/isomerase family protein [Taklimakanibacter deserti]|uniref:enoyl-CoA hydratase/isomerase family protein n=1 Tax=Taklimakanibacter deserti TaxID=2267839 RepID=UPI000E65A85A